MEAKHTPGPWGVNGSHIGPNPDNPMTFCGVASVAGWGPERDANVALIAAAPELLAALIAVFTDWNENYKGQLEDTTIDAMCNAITSATGVKLQG